MRNLPKSCQNVRPSRMPITAPITIAPIINAKARMIIIHPTICWPLNLSGFVSGTASLTSFGADEKKLLFCTNPTPPRRSRKSPAIIMTASNNVIRICMISPHNNVHMNAQISNCIYNGSDNSGYSQLPVILMP